MRSLGIVILIAVVAVGCKKQPKSTQPDSEPPKHVSSVGGAVAPNQNGNLTVTGGGIHAPLVRTAREINEAQLKQLHLSMFQTWSLDNRVPTPNEIMQEARQNSQLLPLLKEEVVILTGAKRGDDIWAYTQYPQRAGEHAVVTRQGIEYMSPEELRKRLQAQGAPIKLAK